MVDEQIQGYRLQVTGLENQTTPIWLCWYHDADHQLSLINSGFDLEFVEHMDVTSRSSVKGFAQG